MQKSYPKGKKEVIIICKKQTITNHYIFKEEHITKSMKEKEKFSDKFKSFALSFRVWLVIFFIIVSFLSINYTQNPEGVAIVGITPNSIAEVSGFEVKENVPLRDLEVIKKIEEIPINSQREFFEHIENNKNKEVTITTTKDTYTIDLSSISQNESIEEELGFSLRSTPSSNIKLGIELEGGSQIILEAKEDLDKQQLEDVINILQSRLNIYGASGTKVNTLENSFSDEKFIFIESTSSSRNDIFRIISRQGEFEAKIGGESIFTGKNIEKVLDDPRHSNIRCPTQTKPYQCGYELSVRIDDQGTQNFYDKTKTLDVIGDHLSEEVCFYLDGEEIECLSIASEFKYNKISTPQISGSASQADTLKEAQEKATEEKDFMKAILSTEKLPTELVVVQSYSITPTLGEELLENAILVGIASLLVVCGIVALRYKKIEIFIGIFIALLSEIIIVLGIAAFLKISIDLAAIGGLIAAIGTGVDDQIIITDEYFRKQNRHKTTARKVKYAFTIILIAYFTTLSAMLPLYLGLKLLQGFAFMTIIGVTIGVLITRPLYGTYLRIITTTKKQREEEKKEEEES